MNIYICFEYTFEGGAGTEEANIHIYIYIYMGQIFLNVHFA